MQYAVQYIWLCVDSTASQIDMASHVGGALSGALVAYLWGPRYVWQGILGDRLQVTWTGGDAG